MEPRTIGQLIRDRRLELGLTQKDIEAATGIEQSYLSHIETGRVKRPGRELLDALAIPLRVPVEALLLAADYAVSQSAEQGIRLSDDDVERVATAVASKIRMVLVEAA